MAFIIPKTLGLNNVTDRFIAQKNRSDRSKLKNNQAKAANTSATWVLT